MRNLEGLLAHLTQIIETQEGQTAHTVIVGGDRPRTGPEKEELKRLLQNLPHPQGATIQVRHLNRLMGTSLEEDTYLIFLAPGVGQVLTWWDPDLTDAELEIYTQLRRDGMDPQAAHLCTRAVL